MKRILIVDDSGFQRKILSEIITSLGYEVECRASGIEMLEAIKTEKFDCICLDLLMPGMSGIEVMQEVQNQENVPPIIIITADIQLKKKEQCMELGAVGFINKAIHKEDIEEVLNSILNA